MPQVRLPDGLELFYEAAGAGEPVVLIHPFGYTGAVWAPIVPRLADRYRVLAPDLRGHGRTLDPAARPLGHRRFAADVAAFLRAVEAAPAHLVGNSTGGHLQFHLARDHPGLARSHTLIAATYTFRPMLDAMRWLDAQPDDRYRAVTAPRHPAQPPDQWRVFRRTFRRWIDDPESDLPFTEDDLAALRAPTLVLVGDRDPYFRNLTLPLTIYRAIPGAELCVLPACGHVPADDQPELLAAVLLDFLRRRA